jgi:hypothetical protein
MTLNAARRRGTAAMQDPDAGLAFVDDDPMPPDRAPWHCVFLVACFALLLLGWFPPVSGYVVLLLVVGMALFRMTALDAAAEWQD